MLDRIQAELAARYDVQVDARVEDFLCERAWVDTTAGDAADRREVLLVREERDGVSVGLYLSPDVLATLKDVHDPWHHADTFGAACLVTEGVSHFLYVAFRAQNGEPVTQLELELQAEVDKYACAVTAHTRCGEKLLAGLGAGLVSARSHALRERLFEDVRFVDGADTEEGERYRLANRLAARYTGELERLYVARGDFAGFERELRRFYRFGAREKIELAGL